MTLVALDEALAPLRGGAVQGGGLAGETTELAPGVWLHPDPEAAIEGDWTSPLGRIAEFDLAVTKPGRWLGLHIALPPFEADGLTWLSLTLRGHAARPMAVKPCLRSGTEAGFSDSFFDRHMLLRPEVSDYAGLMATAHYPDLPDVAPWRELILFLPPAEGLSLALHNVRIVGL